MTIRITMTYVSMYMYVTRYVLISLVPPYLYVDIRGIASNYGELEEDGVVLY